jgi:hypothetical protein
MRAMTILDVPVTSPVILLKPGLVRVEDYRPPGRHEQTRLVEARTRVRSRRFERENGGYRCTACGKTRSTLRGIERHWKRTP